MFITLPIRSFTVTENMNYDNDYIAKIFLECLPYSPNADQIELIARLSFFCTNPNTNSVFLLNGYAGTGKTSLTGALVKTLEKLNIKSVLLAPTGRAAKVFSEYSSHPAYTIHRKIYRQRSYNPEYGGFQLSANKHTNTIFIVDEASMMPNSTSENTVFGSGHLLDDLIEYVYSGQGCKLILLGDNAQLPPVGLDESPALSENQLKGYGLDIESFSLTHSARQADDSGILYNATLLRKELANSELNYPKLELDKFEDFQSLSGEYMTEVISDCYDHDGINDTIIVTRSNKRATLFNIGVRNRILYREEELVAGDRLLVSKNNYFWSEDYEEIDFIANGDVATVNRLKHIENKYGFKFATAELEFPDRNVVMEVKVILDALYSDAPALNIEQQKSLYTKIMAELPGSMREKYKALKKNPYFNALQVKFAYAVTCHKAQGGQWKNVFIDMGYIPEEALKTRDFYRWLYTAVTRAKEKIYLIGNM